MGSFHIMSQAREDSSEGSGRFLGMSLMACMYPPPSLGWGIPPWTQNIWTEREREGTNGLNTIEWLHDHYRKQLHKIIKAYTIHWWNYMYVCMYILWYLRIYHCCNRHCIKDFVSCFPNVFSQRFTKLFNAFTLKKKRHRLTEYKHIKVWCNKAGGLI